ncbi:MAG: DUF4271 domain-containing protein [Siphonobacter sp.]
MKCTLPMGKYTEPVGSLLLHRLRCFWIFIFLFCFGHSGQAQTTGPNNAYYLVHDFRYDWQVYDQSLQAYVPYLREIHQDYGSHNVLLNLGQNRHYYLLYRSNVENYLFIDGALQKKLPIGQWVVFKMDSLYKAINKHEILVTLYGSESGIDNKILQIGHRVAAGQKPIIVSESLLQAEPRDYLPFENFYVLAALLLMVGYAALYNMFPRYFQRYFSIKDLLTIPNRESMGAVVRGPFETSNLVFILILSFVLSYIYQLMRFRGLVLFNTTQLFTDAETLGAIFLQFLLIGIILFTSYLFKYFCITLLSSLFRFEKIANVHFFKDIQAAIIFFSGVSLFMTFLLASLPSFTFHWENYLFGPIIIFFLARALLLYFSINKLADAKNLYMFSYLCIVELVPIIIGVKFAL